LLADHQADGRAQQVENRCYIHII